MMGFGVRLRVSGDYACFTRPEMKVERVSYDVMTPSAARGIVEAIYWKPAIKWIVEEIRVLKPIRFRSIRRNEVGSKASVSAIRKAMRRDELWSLSIVVEDTRQQRAATVLAGVDYIICARFELTSRATACDNAGKHLDTFNRRARKGQCFHQPSLGTREFPARYELVEPGTKFPAPESEDPNLGFGVARHLGLMLYDIDYVGNSSAMFFHATLDRGVMKVPSPDSSEIHR